MAVAIIHIVSFIALINVVVALNLQNNIIFDTTQANRLWVEKHILGNSTNFLYPVDVGPVTECDANKILRVFDENFNLTSAYSKWVSGWETSPTKIKTRRYLQGFAFRSQVTEIRRIEKDVFNNRSCVFACISEKDFVCKTAVYFGGDGGVCALYDVPANTSASSDYYVSRHDAADTWRIYLANETAACEEPVGSKLAHPHFALGWRAMEVGWFKLAHQQFDIAIGIDNDYIMAHVGKVLSNTQMGYGYSDGDGKPYIETLERLEILPGLNVTLSYQSRLVFYAVKSLLKGDTYENGLENMNTWFKNDKTTVRDYIATAIESNSLLLRTGSHQRLANQADDGKLFALRYLTMNLNPYKAGKDQITEATKEAAVSAVFAYKAQDIKGAAPIAAECIDIAEYYAEYALALNLIGGITDFLVRNTGSLSDSSTALFYQDTDRGFLVANGVNVDFMSLPLQRVQEFERLHFYQLQVLGLVAAQRLWDAEKIDPNLSSLGLRAAANGYFSLYGDLLKQNERALYYVEDHLTRAPLEDPVDGTSAYEKINKAYYWTAVAVSKLYGGEDISDNVVSILKRMSGDLPDSYKNLISLYTNIIQGVQAYVVQDLQTAYNKAIAAGDLEIQLEGANFTMEADDYTKYLRNLIPLGLQFKAEMLNSILGHQENTLGSESLSIDSVIAAYREAIAMPPLNTSRSLYGLALALRTKYGDKEKEYNDPIPDHVLVLGRVERRWKDLSDLPENETSNNPLTAASTLLNEYYGADAVGCLDNVFAFSSGRKVCWGGWIIIGAVIAALVIIIIIVAVIFLRKKYKAPATDKEKTAGFVFSGPNLTTDDTSTLQHGYSMNSLSRQSHTSDASPYMSQTLELRRGDYDYTQRSGTLGSNVGAEKLYLNAYGDTN